MFAHYFAGRDPQGRKFIYITETPSLAGLHMEGFKVLKIEVEGKADARKQAAAYGAKCWNF
jgi:hypothetical protein